MIAFENFEKVTDGMNHQINMQNTKEYSSALVAERRSLEAVPEEFIESEADTPIAFVKQKESNTQIP